MSFASDQQSLFREVSSKLDGLEGGPALAAFMGQMLRSLLRRKGDAEFLAAIQDSFMAGMAERDSDQQKAQARELLRVVIEIRPEIAQAWQSQHGEDGAVAAPRRAIDKAEPPPLPPPPPPPPPLPPLAPARALAERMIAGAITETVEQRLQVFRLPAPPFPSITYCHEQPFFLFSAAFAKVVAEFLAEMLALQCRETFDRHIFAPLDARGPMAPEQVEAYLAARRIEMIRILVDRLDRLEVSHRAAEAKLAKAQADAAAGFAGARWKTIEVPVSQPRVLRVLGVQFAVGRRTTMRKVKVRAGADSELLPAEMETLGLITRLRDMAANVGLDLPAACDFRFLSSLLEFDFRRFPLSVKDLAASASAGDRALLFARLDGVTKLFPDTIADAALLMVFAQGNGSGFGVQDLVDFWVAAELGDEAKGSRPFIPGELARRPRELAFQVREVLRRQGDEETLAVAVQSLLTVWQVLPKAHCQEGREAALAVLAAFPVAFAGDPDEAVFIEISQLLLQTLGAERPNWDGCLLAVRAAYFPVVKRRRARVSPSR